MPIAKTSLKRNTPQEVEAQASGHVQYRLVQTPCVNAASYTNIDRL